jgi:hypothetical protein
MQQLSSSLNVIGNITVNNTIINQGLSISGNVSFRSSIFCNTNENKVFTFDGAGFGRLGFSKQSGAIPQEQVLQYYFHI